MRSLRLKKKYIILISIVLIVIIIRLLLPSIILNRINAAIDEMPDYDGHVEDIDLSIYRGAYVIRGLEIKRAESSVTPLELLKLDNIDLAIDWKPILRGNLVGQVTFNHPRLIVTPQEPDSLVKDTASFRAMLKQLMPLKVNRVEINNGTIQYVDNNTSPKVDVSMEQLNVVALNLTNVYDSVNDLPSTISARAAVYEGKLNLDMKLNPLAEKPTFDLNAEMENTNLVLLNDFLKAYGNFTVNKGDFSVFTEIAASKGNFEGYVKPVIKDLDVLGPEDRNESFFQKAWEGIVGVAGQVFKNQEKDQVATKIPIEGTFKNPETKTLYAVGEVLRNAFIQALMPSIDQEISYGNVKKEQEDAFHKIAGENKADDGKKDRKERRKEKKEEKKKEDEKKDVTNDK